MPMIFLIPLLFTLLSCTPKSEPKTAMIHVRTMLPANVPHLDPIHSTNSYSSTINASIFEGLYHYHYLKRPIELEPLLAERMPDVSPDGLRYSIKIRQGVVFQDDPAFPNGKGRELTAEDFVYSWKRLADPNSKALGWWAFDGLIVGLNDWRDQMRAGKAKYDTPVEGLKVVGSHGLEIQLTRKSYQFLHALAMPVTMVVAREVVEKYGNEIVNHPVGTGPFVLKEWIRNSKIELVKNPNYRKVVYPTEGSAEAMARGLLSSQGQPLPLADQVTVSIFREFQPLWLSFLNGEIDRGIIPKDNYDQVMTNNQLNEEYVRQGIEIFQQPRPDVTYISFNMEHPILGKSKKLRQAMAHALDRDLILEKFYNRRGLVAQGPIPPGLDGYNENYQSPIQYDLEKARQLMTEAGFPEGKGLPEFDYQLPNVSVDARQMGEFLKDAWSKIGVKIRLNANTWPQFDQKIKNKNATLFDMAWMADYPDAQNFMQLFYSRNISPGPNSANFINRTYDTIYESAVTMAPGPERNQQFAKLVEILNEEVPSVFIIHRVNRIPLRQWLLNFNEDPIIFDYYKYLSVHEKKKAELVKSL